MTHPDVAAARSDFESALKEYGQTCKIEVRASTVDSTGAPSNVWVDTDPAQTLVPCWVSDITTGGGMNERELSADRRSAIVWSNVHVPVGTIVPKGARVTINETTRTYEVRDYGDDTIGLSMVLICVDFEVHT